MTERSCHPMVSTAVTRIRRAKMGLLIPGPIPTPVLSKLDMLEAEFIDGG